MPQNYDACFPATTPPTVYTNTGATTAFAVGFPSLKQNDIVVFTGSDADSTWTIVDQDDYSVNSQGANNAQQVVFNAAPGADVLIMRRTDLCTLVRTFQAGQSIRAQDLNNSFLQQLYLSQEMYEFLRSQFGVDDLNPGTPSLDDTFWNKDGDTIASGEAWVSDDDHIATTAAGDARWLNSTGDIQEGDGITITEAGGNVTINQSTLDPDPSGTFSNAIVTVDALGRVTNAISGDSGDGLTIVDNTAALNTLAATLGASDAGTAVLIEDSTNVDGTAQNPGANNPAPNPAIANLPAAPTGGWDNTVQTAVQWSGAAWTFIRYQASNPDNRYVNLNDGGTRQRIISAGLEIGRTADNGGDNWRFLYAPGGSRPESNFLAGGAGAHDVFIGERPGTVGNHGISLRTGDERQDGTEANPPQLEIQSTLSDTSDHAFIIYGGTTQRNNVEVPEEQVIFATNGDAAFNGVVSTLRQQGFRLSSDTGSVTLQGGGFSQAYNYIFPPATPGNGNNWTLACNIADNATRDCTMSWVQMLSQNAGDGRYLQNANPPVAATGQGGGDTMIGQLTLGAAALSNGSCIVATERTVPNNAAWSLGATNVWIIPDGATVQFPLDNNLNIGPPENQTGVFVLRGLVTAWSDVDANRGWRFPGGNVITGTANQTTIVPFLVTETDGLNDIVIRLGNPTVTTPQ